MKTIFVSSTFRDMHFERDAIQDQVMPRINAAARKYGQSVSFCDLRWGINTDDLESDAGSRKVLDVCLDEIDRCQPPMVVILGDRYGWIPESSLIETAAQRKQMQLDSLRKSVTALEIEYGALASSERSENTLFYFREFDGPWPEGFEEEDEEHTALLKDLKNRIRSLTGGRIRTYTVRWEGDRLAGVDAFADMLTEDLEALLLPQWESFDRMTPHQKEMHTHWSFVQEKAAMFRARKATAQTLLADIRGNEKQMILQGGSGLGKSTLLAYLATQLREDYHVIPVICGLTQKSNTAMDVLHTIVFSLEELLGFEHIARGDAGQQKKQKLTTKQWVTRLNDLCDECTAAQKKVAILVDAADQLLEDAARKKLIFIPDNLSQYVRFVMTCLPELPLQGRRSRQLQPIEEAEKRLIIAGMLDEKNRELSEPVIRAILKKPASDTPLYLSLLVQRLLMMNKEDFDAIRALGDGMAAITQYQKGLVAACPDDLSAMSVELLRVTGQRINGPMVTAVAQLIGLSRHGLRQQDLAVLLGSSFNTLDFAHFISYMSDCFLLRSDGRYDFSHKSIRAGFRSLPGEQTGLHEKLYDYFSTLPEDDEVRVQERGYHCLMIRDGEKLRGFIHQLYLDKNGGEKETTATALVHFCLESDENVQWMKALMVPGEAPEVGLSIARLVSYWMLPDFAENENDEKRTGTLFAENRTLAQKVYTLLRTELSGRILASALEDYAAYCHRQKDKYAKQMALVLRKQAVELTEKLVTEFGSANSRMDLASAYRMLAWSYECAEEEDSDEKALHYYEKALELRKALNEENTTPSSRRSLAIIYDDIADLYNSVAFQPLNAEERALPLAVQPVYHKHHREYAAQLYQKALELRKQLVEEDPSANNRRNLAYSYRSLAKLHENQPEKGQREKVIAYYQQEEAILRELYAEGRSLSQAGDLSDCLMNLGTAWYCSGKRQDYQKAYDCYVAAARLRMTVFLALRTVKNGNFLAAARFAGVRVLYRVGGENNLRTALSELNAVHKFWISAGVGDDEWKMNMCRFYLTAVERALGMEPPAFRADLTQFKYYKQSYAYAELLEILEFTADELVEVIPVGMMSVFRYYSLPTYRPHLDRSIPLEDQDISKKTAALIAMISMSVWCASQEERDELGAILDENDRLKQAEASGTT